MKNTTSDFDLQFLNYPISDTNIESSAHEHNEEELFDAYSWAVTSVVKKVGPAVAHVHVKKKAANNTRSPSRELEPEFLILAIFDEKRA